MFNTTEITSHELASDNVIHQRLCYAYVEAAKRIQGSVLELGCGVGRGIEAIANVCSHYAGIDKNPRLLQVLQQKYSQFSFIEQTMPPLQGVEDSSFDEVISFQVIEHIQDDHLFLKEVKRVLKPGGTAIITTPNAKLSLTRNPWHVREYTATQLKQLLEGFFSAVTISGIYGSDRVAQYYEQNKTSVRKIVRFDIFKLQQRLPQQLLQVIYPILNRLNRQYLMKQNIALVAAIDINDYYLKAEPDGGFDLFCTMHKN